MNNDVQHIEGVRELSKDTTDTTGLRLPWAGKKVRTEEVEEELSFFWRMSADNVRTNQNINVRTSVLNLVICAPDTESAQQASAIIRNLSSTHIARVILLILDTTPTIPGSVATWVTLRSFPILSDTMRHSFEQVTLVATGSAVRAVGNILQPLLKPDLPTYVWWLNDLPDDKAIFLSLTELSSRIIVDSSSFFAPEQSISALSSVIEEAPNCALSDLNWGRITPWRQLVAQFFDVAEYKPYLAGVDSIEIEHAAAPFALPTRTESGEVSPNPARALLFAAWLKTSLGWKLSPNAEHSIHIPETGTYSWRMIRHTSPLRSRSGATGKLGKPDSTIYGKVDIRPRVVSDMPPGTLCLIRLISTIDNKRATFTINREDDPNLVLTSVDLPQGTRPQRTVSMTATREASELLHDELEIMGREQLYEETLQEVFDLLIQE